jgi:hypothetical protein
VYRRKRFLQEPVQNGCGSVLPRKFCRQNKRALPGKNFAKKFLQVCLWRSSLFADHEYAEVAIVVGVVEYPAAFGRVSHEVRQFIRISTRADASADEGAAFT